MTNRGKPYRVTGAFLIGHRYQKFSKEILATDPREKIYSEFGSKHRVRRKHIRIEKVEKLKKNEITDPIVKACAEEI